MTGHKGAKKEQFLHTDGTGRTDQPKVVQEVLADLKTSKNDVF